MTSVIVMLFSLLLPALRWAREAGRTAVCASNARQLAHSNMAYSVDHRGAFVQAARDIWDDLGDGQGGHFRWHGFRSGAGQPFDPAQGPLSGYPDLSGQVKTCPTFAGMLNSSGGSQFELGTGGYGYNHQYVGGRNDLYGFPNPNNRQASEMAARGVDIVRPNQTVMFADAGIAQKSSELGPIVAEYSFLEPPFFQLSPGPPSTFRPSPSIHFRHGTGSANVAWADGHVDGQQLSFSNLSYGLNVDEVAGIGVGWFGPEGNDKFDLH